MREWGEGESEAHFSLRAPRPLQRRILTSFARRRLDFTGFPAWPASSLTAVEEEEEEEVVVVTVAALTALTITASHARSQAPRLDHAWRRFRELLHHLSIAQPDKPQAHRPSRGQHGAFRTAVNGMKTCRIDR